MNDALAQKTIHEYVCSRCWGQLTLLADKETRWKITCLKCGDDQGFVTREYAVQRQAESAAEAIEVKQLLAGLGVIQPAPKKSNEQIIRELGF